MSGNEQHREGDTMKSKWINQGYERCLSAFEDMLSLTVEQLQELAGDTETVCKLALAYKYLKANYETHKDA